MLPPMHVNLKTLIPQKQTADGLDSRAMLTPARAVCLYREWWCKSLLYWCRYRPLTMASAGTFFIGEVHGCD